MKKTNAILVCLLFLGIQHSKAGAGGSGFSFLTLGISGQGVAMADAVGAHTSGAAATFYNPAGLVHDGTAHPGTQLLFMHKEWIQDSRTQFLGASVPIGDESSLGISLNNTTVSDIEIRTRPGPSEGTFTSRNFSLGLSYAQRLNDDLTVGITGKFLYEKLLVDEASGFALDFGSQFQTPIEGLALGVTIANIGSVSELRSEKSSLPSYMRIGPSFRIDLPDISSKLLFASDVIHIFPDGLSLVGFGGEIVFQEMVAIRTGYQLGYEARGFSTGGGITYGVFTLDYAFAPLTYDLGSSHTIALVLNL